jgi:hypothetical protein
MERDIKEVVQSCIDCQMGLGKAPEEWAKQDKMQEYFTYFHNLRLFDILLLDIVVGLPQTSRRGHQHILVLVECLSGFPWAFHLRSKEPEEILSCLWSYICEFCCPRRIRHDRGGEFVDKAVKLFCESFGIQGKPSSSHRPETQGQVEVMNRSVVSRLENLCRDHPEDWDLMLDSALLGVRIQANSRTGLSPYEVLFGQAPNIPLMFK